MVAVAATASLTGSIQPAYAADGVVAGGVWISDDLGDGTVVAALCTAHATAERHEIPVATTVWCSIGTLRTPPITMAGGFAAVPIANALDGSTVELCVHAEAIFVPVVIGDPRTETRDLCFVF